MAIIDKFRIGTRGSALALAQSGQVIDKLKAKHSALQEPGATSLVVIKTTGDREQSRLLAEIGGKGLFTKELDEAMLRGDIDLAIHSMKDMPTYLPEGIVLHAITERVDARDAFISSKAKNIAELPEGAEGLALGNFVAVSGPDQKLPRTVVQNASEQPAWITRRYDSD